MGARPQVQWGGVPGASGKRLLLPLGRGLSFLTSSQLPLPARLLSARSLLQGMGVPPTPLLISNGSPGVAGRAAPALPAWGSALSPFLPPGLNKAIEEEPAVAMQTEGHRLQTRHGLPGTSQL